MFAREGSLDAVPLPSGMFTPADAMTPACMIPVPPPAPKIHSGILKKPIERKFRKVPPGPPCIPPPDYDDYGETAIVVRQGIPKRSVKFDEQVREEEIPLDDDYGPVESEFDTHLRLLTMTFQSQLKSITAECLRWAPSSLRSCPFLSINLPFNLLFLHDNYPCLIGMHQQ